jgi:predicted XRE-type DNA-binding protein
MNVDTEIRHVTKAGANIFAELGFSASEAEQFHAESQQHINNTLALKEQLMSELSKWIADNHLSKRKRLKYCKFPVRVFLIW